MRSRSEATATPAEHAGGPVFPGGFHLGSAAEALRADGVAVVDRALTESFRQRLLHEVAAVPFEPAPRVVGPVRQEVEEFVVRELRQFPAVAQLTRQFVRLVRAEGRLTRELASWAPNEISLQCYRPGSLGITSHRDRRRYRRLVAVFSVSGSASLVVPRERHGEILGRFLLGPGSLVLLRAPGLAGMRDGRPFHAVTPLGAEERLTIGLRMNTQTSGGTRGTSG